MGQGEESLYSEHARRAICFFFVFGGSIPMKLQSNLVSLPGIITYFLETSKEALAKRVSMAQARFQRQNKHANEADKQSLHSDNQERAILFFACLWRQHNVEVHAEFA